MIGQITRFYLTLISRLPGYPAIMEHIKRTSVLSGLQCQRAIWFSATGMTWPSCATCKTRLKFIEFEKERKINVSLIFSKLLIFKCFNVVQLQAREREREMFNLTTHLTHFIYGYMASDIWLRTILIVRKETRCRHIGYSYRLTARVLLYAPSHRQDNTYHGLCYTSRGALAGTKNSSMGPPHEGSIRRPIAP